MKLALAVLDSFRTLPTLLQWRAQQTPDAIALCSRQKNGSWDQTNWNDYFASVGQIAQGLQYLGLQVKDKVGVMACTSKNWDLAQMAIMSVSAIVVGIDAHDIEERINHLVVDSEIQGLIVQNVELLKKFNPDVLIRLRFVVCIENHTQYLDNDINIIPWQRLPELNAIRQHSLPKPDDIATIIYTSGTTGEPKGIPYTHEQVCIAVKELISIFPEIEESSRLICWLPLSNLFQRIINFCAIGRNATIYYVEDPKSIIEQLPQIEPHLFIAVPRFYEKLYEGIQKSISQQPRFISKLTTIVHSSRSKNAFMQSIYEWMLKKIRSRIFGRNLKYMFSGSAAMPKWLLEEFFNMGILILEAYGISENILPISMNQPTSFKFGSVGQTLQGNIIKFSGDGELLVKGPCVFRGYFGSIERPENLTEDGFLKTGDYASKDVDGFITITGRKSEIIKTSTGRRIAPAVIESLLMKLNGVEQVVIFGHQKKFLIAFIALAENFQLSDENINALCEQARQQVKHLASYQQPAGFLILPRPLTISANELTSNLKLRRNQIEINFQNELTQLYAQLTQATNSRTYLVIH